MRRIKFSRQREAIKELLAESSHPTADEIYIKVREQFPNVSLGTVYRNLNLLSECGEIQKLTFPEGPDRFDCNVMPHYHFVCRSCGRVFDLHVRGVKLDMEDGTDGAELPGRIEAQALICYGTCNDCLADESQDIGA